MELDDGGERVMSEMRIDPYTWLEREASACLDPGALLVALCQQLIAVGIPLQGATLKTTTLNPLAAGSTFVWHRDRPGPLEAPRLHGMPDALSPSLPPIAAEHGARGAESSHDIVFGDGSCQSLIFNATDRLDRAQRSRLRRVAQRLAAPLETVLTRQTAATLLTTYLGRRSGERVLAGAVRRGDGETIDAVLWYSDLRGFTALSERLAPGRLIALLNAHFERLAAPIKAFGGEVLKFMGDGVLAIFPTAPAGPAAACSQALKAARGARAGMASLDSERLAAGGQPLGFGLALHRGDVHYGNVGAPDRLDFTVIGPAVNLASRLETQCKRLGYPVLTSAAFAEACNETLAPLGSHQLQDIARPEPIFTLPELAAGPDQLRPGAR